MLGTLLATSAGAEEFEIRAGQGDNVVRFESKAALETFDGKTDQVSGRISLDRSDVRDTVSVYIEVDLASLDTGIERRNRHMRENHLETAEYPTAVFSGAAILDPPTSRLDPGQTVDYDIEGTLDLHGVKRRIRTVVRVTYLNEKAGMLHIATHFVVNLAAYNISRPKFLFLKLGEDQKVTFDVVAFAKS